MLNRRDISFLRHSISLHTPLSSDFQLLAPDVDLMLQEGDLRCRPFNRHFALSAARVTDRPCLGPNNSDSNPQWLQLSCGEYLKQAPVSSVSILSHSLPQPTAFRAFVLSFLYPLGTITAGLLFLSSLGFRSTPFDDLDSGLRDTQLLCDALLHYYISGFGFSALGAWNSPSHLSRMAGLGQCVVYLIFQSLSASFFFWDIPLMRGICNASTTETI